MKKKLTSGTATTAIEKRILTSDEVCAIIKACNDARVAVLKFGDLEIQFHQKVEPLAFEHGPQGWQRLQPTQPEAEISEQQQQLHEKSFDADEIRVKQDQLDQMLIEDPHEFEKLMAQNELEDEESGTVDDAEAGRT